MPPSKVTYISSAVQARIKRVIKVVAKLTDDEWEQVKHDENKRRKQLA
jgi:hypothetical protein